MHGHPAQIESERLIVRLWRAEDAVGINRAIGRSEDHLRPWMPWIAFGLPTEAERSKQIAEWHAQWEAGGDATYGVFTRDGTIVGGSGLHDRSSSPGVIDVGYWIHVDHVGRGYATETTAALRGAAFSLPRVVAVDIHHDKANVASARVPEKLGFDKLGERPDEVTAPGEVGIDCHWRSIRTEEVAMRTATESDRPSIVALVRDAFSNGGRDGSEEIDIVERTWAADAVPTGLEVVAVEDGEIVGHVLCARADLGGHDVLAVAPLAVSPARHRAGIGSALMREVIRRSSATGEWPLIALLGSVDYYSRFGFEPSGPLGITYRPVGPDNPHFQVLRLASYDASLTGDFVYCWER